MNENVNIRFENAASECPICFEPYTKDGLHRITTTKCGHLFGLHCILKSLTINPTCPSCRKRARKRELVQIYDTGVVAVDSSDMDNLKLELIQERKLREKVLLKLEIHLF